MVHSRTRGAYFCPPEQLPDTSRIDVTRSDARLLEDMLPVDPAVEPAVEPVVEDGSLAFSIVPRISTRLLTYLSRSSLLDAISFSPCVVALGGSALAVDPVVPVVELAELLPGVTFVSVNWLDMLELAAPGAVVEPVVPVAPDPVPRSTQPVTVTFLLDSLWLL